MSLVLAFSASTTANAADIAPPTNVNCSVNLSGAQCSAAITSTGSSLTNALSKTEWYVSILSLGALPTDVASYGPLIFVKSTESGVSIGAGVNIGAGVSLGTGSIDLSYETLLGFTKNDPQGTVLISARTFNSANEATPFFGQRSYLALTEVKALMAAAEAKAIVDKSASDKTLADNAADKLRSVDADDAVNNATDAALSAAEAAEAATAMAQVAVDTVAELSAQVANLMSELRMQITSLSNLIVKIRKKVHN